MKRKLIINLILLNIFLLASCSNEMVSSEDSEIITSESENNAITDELDALIDIYRESVKTMQESLYTLHMSGISDVSLSKETIRISEYVIHTPDKIYFEKASNGDAVNLLLTKIPTAYGERAYISKDVCRRSSATTDKAWNEKDGMVIVDNWSEGKDSTLEQIYKDFGKSQDSYIDFNIDVDTIIKDNFECISNDDGYYLSFSLLIDDGLKSKSILGYSNQVYTMSKRTLASIEKIDFKINLSKDYKVISYESNQKYQVYAAGLKATVINKLNYKFNYFDELEVTYF